MLGKNHLRILDKTNMVKIMFVGDMHDEDPSGRILVEQADSGIEKVVCLGDYDTPEVLRNIRKLKIPKLIVIGNHDYHYVCAYRINPTSNKNKRLFDDYVSLWDSAENKKEKKFIMNAIDGKDRSKKSGILLNEEIDGQRVVYSHASLVDMDSPDSDVPGYVWTRLTFWHTKQREVNFRKMAEKNYGLFFRGHDHEPQLLSQAIGEDNADKTIVQEEGFGTIELRKDRRYIINPGAFVRENSFKTYGCWAIWDSEKSTIEFKSLRV